MTRHRARSRRSCALPALLLAAGLVPASALAQQFQAPEPGTPVTLEARESMAWDRRAGTVTARGAARLAYGELLVMAEELIGHRLATGDAANNNGGPPVLTRVVGTGDVLAHAPPLTVTGERGEVDLAAYRAVVTGRPARFKMAAAGTSPAVTGRADERLVYDGPALTLTLSGGARIDRRPYRLSGATITARFDPAPEAQASSAGTGWPPAPDKLARAEATGDVVLAGPEGTVRGNRAVYDRLESRIAVVGDVVLERAANTVSGDAAVLDLDAEEVTVTGRGDRRVRAVVAPAGGAPELGE